MEKAGAMAGGKSILLRKINIPAPKLGVMLSADFP